jgi:uncharacterized protein with FMN-binding domain
MRRISLWFLSTVAVVTLLFGYHTSTSGATTTAVASGAAPSTGSGSATSGSSGSSGTGTSGSGTSGSGTSGSGTSGSGSSSAAGQTVTGSVAQTRWGPVQVQLTVTGGKITNVDVVQYPDGNGRDREINAYALPVLVQETISAQSANIDMVSGATVTSDGYVTSLQSALDQAGIK